jgi:hypothetical protein
MRFREERVNSKIRILLLCFIFIIPLSGLCAQSYDIDVNNLPSDQAFRKDFDEFLPLYKYVAAWNPEWKADIPKKKVITLLQSLLEKTSARAVKANNKNIDLLLLQALLKSCLYNCNLDAYHDKVVADLQSIKKRYPKDYRAYWMLANHYGFSDDPYSAMREYDVLFSQVLQGKGSQPILADYLAANFYTYMFARCKAIIDDIAVQGKIKDVPNTFWMYRALLDQLKSPPVDSFVPKEMLFTAQARAEEVGFLSRALGIWIPVKSTWKTEALGLTSQGIGNFTIRYPVKSAKGGMITTSINVVFQANPKQGYEEFMNKLAELPTKKQENSQLKSPWPATVIEYWDSKSFTSFGGGHGIMVFVKRAAPAIKSIAIEAPAKLPSKDQSGKVTYAVLGEGYTRFDGDIYYAFILDCADQAFQASKTEFFGFLDRVLLD